MNRLPAKEEERREWIVKIRRKNPPTYTKHLSVVPTYPVSWEGNVQDHVKALRNRARQFEAGCMAVYDDLMEERIKAV